MFKHKACDYFFSLIEAPTPKDENHDSPGTGTGTRNPSQNMVHFKDIASKVLSANPQPA